jgi:hypothetical protein
MRSSIAASTSSSVVVLGRPYTIYNPVLSSNVPPLLREQGAIGIPIDCYEVEKDVPTFDGVYWGHGQRNLRAAHQIRRTPGLYGIWCSNYSCGPDSFNLHFFSYAMTGVCRDRTDGHAGDAGARRGSGPLHRARSERSSSVAPDDQRVAQRVNRDIEQREHLLMRMGEARLAACIRGVGISASSARPDRDALRIDAVTSGKGACR